MKGSNQVRQACDPDSLADFAWDMFSAWLFAAAPSKEGWAFMSLGLFGTDDTARKLTPFIRAWPGEAQHQRAVNGLEVLNQIGSDVALMLLNGIAQKVKFKGLQDRAREKIAAIAEARELTIEELEDRLAPDLGLDENGSLRLDFGDRQFTVSFDETLKPFVRDMDGTRLKDLPKPKKTDNQELANEAVNIFKLLKKMPAPWPPSKLCAWKLPCASAAAGHLSCSSCFWYAIRWYATWCNAWRGACIWWTMHRLTAANCWTVSALPKTAA